MSAEIAAVLRRAAELITEPEKWCQGSYRGYVGPRLRRMQRCPKTAIRDAGDEMSARDIKSALWALQSQLPRGFSIEDWNDRAGRTHAEVLAALRAAAEAGERDA